MSKKLCVLTVDVDQSGRVSAMLDDGVYDGGQKRYSFQLEKDTLRQLIDRQSAAVSDNNRQEVEQLGGVLMQILIPKGIRDDLPPDGSALLLSTNEHDIPWELLWDREFFGVRYAMGRQWLTDGNIPTGRRGAGAGYKKCLILTNPTEDLPDAQKEATQLMRYFRQHGFSCTLLSGRHVTAADVLVQLGSGTYDMVHYSGHVQSDEQGAFLPLADSGRFYLKEILHLDDIGRPFLFINGCGPQRGGTANVATPLIYAGGGPIVCTWLPVTDAGSRLFSECIISHVLDGMTYGQATMEARREFSRASLSTPDWMCFTYYGNPLDVMKKSEKEVGDPQPPKENVSKSTVPGQPTAALRSILGRADGLAGDKYVISTSHLFASILMEQDPDIIAALDACNASAELVELVIGVLFDTPGDPKVGSVPPADRYSENARRAVERASLAAQAEKRMCLPSDVCRALLSRPNMLTEILDGLGIDSKEMLKQL